MPETHAKKDAVGFEVMRNRMKYIRAQRTRLLNQISQGIKPQTNMLVHAPALGNPDFKDSDYEAYYQLREQASTG